MFSRSGFSVFCLSLALFAFAAKAERGESPLAPTAPPPSVPESVPGLVPQSPPRVRPIKTAPAPAPRTRPAPQTPISEKPKVPIVCVEREGTLVERGARTAEEVRLVSFAEDAIDLLNRKGYAIYVISNYPEVAHRVVSLEEAARIHAAFEKLIDPRGNLISSYKYCHHLPGDPDCACHKPKTGNLPRVHLGSLIAYEKSFAVGDMVCDVRFGFAFRGTGALVETGNGKKTLEEELVHLTELHAKTMVCSNLLNFAESVPNHSKE